MSKLQRIRIFKVVANLRKTIQSKSVHLFFVDSNMIVSVRMYVINRHYKQLQTIQSKNNYISDYIYLEIVIKKMLLNAFKYTFSNNYL